TGPGHGAEYLQDHYRIPSRPVVGRPQPTGRDHLPVHIACYPPAIRNQPSPTGAQCMTTSKANSTIYIVDDDEAVRDSLQWLLEANGYHVQCFAGGEAFLNVYDPDHVGVLIVDVRMPGMSGLELQEILIQRDAPLPIVFITGHGDVPMAVSTMKKGAVDFLEKPFNESELRTIVARMLVDAQERVKQARLARSHQA